MSDRAAIENVLASWALGYDERDPSRMAACFTDDAVMTMDVAGVRRLGPFDGHEQVMGLFTEHQGEQSDQRRHVTTNVVIDEPTADGTPVTSYLALMVTQDGDVRLQATGVYRDLFVNTGTGWKIRRRDLHLDREY